MMYLQFNDAKGTLKWPQGSCKGGNRSHAGNQLCEVT